MTLSTYMGDFELKEESCLTNRYLGREVPRIPSREPTLNQFDHPEQLGQKKKTNLRVGFPYTDTVAQALKTGFPNFIITTHYWVSHEHDAARTGKLKPTRM